MKHLFTLLLVLLGATAVQASWYHPFAHGMVYQLSESATPGDTLHTVRMGFNLQSYPDSIYRLHAARLVRRASNGCGGQFVSRSGEMFGGRVVVVFLGGGTWIPRYYQLKTPLGNTFTLKPYAPLNQPWTATAGGLTARVTARSLGTVLGQPDSIVTITLSDGKSLRIGKKYGWIEGPALGAYIGSQPPRYLTTTAITGAFGFSLGTPLVGARAVFDYQPGDVFLRMSTHEGATAGRCYDSWQRDSVLTRTLSASGETVTYTIWRRTLTRNYGAAGGPPGTCSGQAGYVLGAPFTTTLTVNQLDATPLALLTNTAATLNNSSFANAALTFPGVRTAAYQRRPVQRVIIETTCPTSNADSTLTRPDIDNYTEYHYAAGLGQVYAKNSGIAAILTTTLLGYQKVNLPTGAGTETWGSLRTFAQILKAKDYQPAATTAAFPNPFSRELTLKFEATKAQPVQVLLYNALGQLVHAQQASATAGTQQLPVQAPALPAGLYTLHLRLDGRTEVLKVVKAE